MSLLLLFAIAFAACVALATIYGYQRLTFASRIATARVGIAGGPSGFSPSALRGARRRLPFLDFLPLRESARQRAETQLERAGVPLRVSEYTALRIGSAIAATVAFTLVSFVVSLPDLVTVPGAVAALLLGWSLPGMWVSRKRRERLELIEEQLPPALTALAKSLRAGTGLLQGLSYTAEETPAPLGPELEQTLRELRLGANAEDAFEQLSARVGSADLDIAVTAILIQRSVGGNLSEILTNVSTTIRERAKIMSELRVLTARQVLTGNLMACMPVGIAALFILVNPAMGRLLIDDTIGRISAGVGIGFEVLGLVLIRKLGKIEI
jgi:tight adherence protein B